MCLLVKKGCKIEIAEKDITTYKYVNSYKNNWIGIFFPVPSFTHNKLQKAKCLSIDDLPIDLKHLQGEKCGDEIIINEGFHSLLVKPSFLNKLFICIIPKGSEYCFGEDNDIVSNQIIVFKTRQDYDRYIASKVSSN